MVDNKNLYGIDDNILFKCKNLIREKIGDLDDIPYEVANTIANCYYHFYEYLEKEIGEHNKNPNTWIPEVMKNESNLAMGYNKYMKTFTRLYSIYEDIPMLINRIRKLDDGEEKELLYHVFLDVFKYDIDNPLKKTELRLNLERKMKKSSVKEIPNLIDLLDI